jgi:PAS domain S-box-containing protein
MEDQTHLPLGSSNETKSLDWEQSVAAMAARLRKISVTTLAIALVGFALILLDFSIGPFIGHGLILGGITGCLVLLAILRERTFRRAESLLRQARHNAAASQARDMQLHRAMDELLGLCATTTGPGFFESVARQLAESCGADFVAISEVSVSATSESPVARTVAYISKGRLLPAVSYSLHGTPCHDVITGGFCHHTTGVAEKFPADPFLRDLRIESYMAIALRGVTGIPIGLITLLGHQRLPDPVHAERALRAIAGRAGAELERAAADRSLRESESRLQAVIQNSPGVAVQWYDHNGRVVLWNRASEAMFGFAAEEAMGRTLDQLIHTPHDAADFLNLLGSIAESGRPVGPAEFPFRRKNGEQGVCISTVFAVPGENSSLCFVCMDVDITRQRKAEEALRQSQKLQAIGQLAGGIAHDFNNLLFIINGYGDLLLRELDDRIPSHRQCVESMLEAGRRAAMLTRQLLTFSRRQTVEPKVLDLHAELRQMQATLGELLPPTVRLQFELTAPNATIRIDPTQLQQIVMNLVINAKDAMPHGGTVTVRTDAAESESPTATSAEQPVMRLIVRDTGEGMTPEVRDRIFEPFFTTKGPGKGTGLGLATVYGAVQESGGEITVESREGEGSTFTIRWPLVKHSIAIPPRDAGGASDEPLPKSGNEIVLFVEDEDSVRKLVSKYLRDAGYVVLEASSADEARRIVSGSHGPIRLLITDMVMASIGGRELADEMQLALPRIPVLFISGHSDDATSRRGSIGSQSAFLQKPFSFVTLGRTVRELLDAAAKLDPVPERT